MTSPENIPTYGDFLRILRRSTELLTDDPVKEEIFSVERLEQYAAHLAQEFAVSPTPIRGKTLHPEMKACGKQLQKAYFILVAAVRAKHQVSPAAEWFLDNFHIVEEQLISIKGDLPKEFYAELPKLTTGELAGYPRIYAIALAIIAHTDSRLDVEMLKRFITSFQTKAPLQIGELWAIAITLRIALIEQLNLLTLRITDAWVERGKADDLADRVLERASKLDTDPEGLVEMLAHELGPAESLNRAFIVQLTQRLRDQDPDVWPIFDWLENQLKAHHTNTIQVTHLEHHRQAASQVTVGNIITSLRLLSALDWRDFFESVSVVDSILAKDPHHCFSKMDFPTRDEYRHAIERIAKRSKATELEVAQMAVDLAQASLAENAVDQRRSHVGFYLVSKGVVEIEKKAKYRLKIGEILSRLVRRNPTTIYLGSMGLLTLLTLAPLLLYFVNSGGRLIWAVLFCIFASVPASEFAQNILNQYITFFMKPKLLPKMETEKGIPQDAKTMVVIPTLLGNEHTVNHLLERLEIYSLANSDPKISFALLGDFLDAPSETLPTDAGILELAQKGIDHLNSLYSPDPLNPKFLLFHRRRQWNPSEGKWIGWERKRGKIFEFNHLLRGASDTSYIQVKNLVGLKPFLADVKYVITLDSDTQLPRNAARRLIGTIIHPLNQPYFCPIQKRVIDGYGILQPRISVDLISGLKTRFSRLFSDHTGLDPYTTAVSDVYQDLFREGSFTGKGLYVVDIFEAALANRCPENTILSHDLFEGLFARTALVSDIELYDDYPSDYETFSKRQHRWTRGDWQIAPWLFARVPNAQGEKNPLRYRSSRNGKFLII